MACRRQAHELTADTYAYYGAETVTVQECYSTQAPRGITANQELGYGRQAEPCNASSYPAWQGTAVEAELVAGRHAFGMGADHQAGNVQVNIVVHNLHVNQQYPAAMNGTTLISEEAAPRIERIQQQADDVVQVIEAQAQNFHNNDPEFRNCAYDQQGVDFGRKAVSRRYRAKKHAHSRNNMTTYTQCPSKAQAFSHVVTLQLSHKSCKHIIFVSDGGCVDQHISTWPSNIHFSDIQSLIQQLGPEYEYHRCKVKNRRFSLYIYLVKPFGVEFSNQGRRTWSSLSQWAHSLERSSASTSNLSSAQVIAQVAGIGLSIVGAL